MKSALILFHRWLGLATAILIFVVAATGSALVFEGAMDRGLNPQLWRVTPAASPLPLDILAARITATLSGSPLTGLSLARAPGQAYVGYAGSLSVFIDPFTGRVLGRREQRDANKSLPRRLHVLHTSLMAGERGSAVVAIVTAAALLLVVTGAFIWWSEKLWRINWSASWKRIAYDVHHSLGITASLVLFVITASGMVIHYGALSSAIRRLNAGAPPKIPLQMPAPDGMGTISFDSLARVAQAALPGATITFLSTPPRPDEPMAVSMRYPEDRTPAGRSRVVVDRYRGTTLFVSSTRLAETGSRINNVMRSVHTGDILGKPTEVVWLLAAIILASQSVTGALMWVHAQPARAAQKRRANEKRQPPERATAERQQTNS